MNGTLATVIVGGLLLWTLWDMRKAYRAQASAADRIAEAIHARIEQELMDDEFDRIIAREFGGSL